MALLKFVHFWLCFTCISAVVIFNPTFRQICFATSAFLVLLPIASWFMYFTRKFILNPYLSSKGKAVLITGCDSGFGNQLAEKLCQKGYHVFAGCLDVKSEGAEKLRKSCSEKVEIILLDVTNPQHVQNALEYVKQNLNNEVLWAIVNNAGIAQAGEIDWTPLEEFQKVYEVNVTGMVRVTKTFLPFLRESKGRVVNTTSFCARLTSPGYVGYCMSKSSSTSFITGLRVEMARWGIRSISIEPFFYKTPLTTVEANQKLIQSTWDKAPEETKEAYGNGYIDAFKKQTAWLLKHSSPHTSDVLYCLVDAVASRDPLDTYFPCFLPHKILLLICLILPHCVAETFGSLQLPRLRKRDTSKNSESTKAGYNNDSYKKESLDEFGPTTVVEMHETSSSVIWVESTKL